MQMFLSLQCMSISRGVKLSLIIYLFFANLDFHLGTGAEKVGTYSKNVGGILKIFGSL